LLRFRLPVIRRHVLRCCSSQFPAPFHRKTLRLACLEAREPPLTTPLPWRSNHIARHRPWLAFRSPAPRGRYASSRGRRLKSVISSNRP
jgi:hypothetical protein